MNSRKHLIFIANDLLEHLRGRTLKQLDPLGPNSISQLHKVMIFNLGTMMTKYIYSYCTQYTQVNSTRCCSICIIFNWRLLYCFLFLLNNKLIWELWLESNPIVLVLQNNNFRKVCVWMAWSTTILK